MAELNELEDIARLKLRPFERQIRECPKCGYGPWRVPGWIVQWFDLPWTRFKVIYCAGGMEAEKTVMNVTLMGAFEQTVTVACAGVSQAHLHQFCQHCGFHFLMETKDAQRGAR